MLALLPDSKAVGKLSKAEPQRLFYLQSDPWDYGASFNKLVVLPKQFASELQHIPGGRIKRTAVMKSALSLIC